MNPSRTRALILVVLMLVGSQATAGASPQAVPGRLKVTEAAIQALLTRTVFNQEGRWYLKEPSDCGYGIVQNHSVELADGVISIRAKLYWSEAKRLLGECRGPSTNFEVLATASPVADGGTVGLRNIQVTAPDGNVVALAALALLKSKIPSSYDVDVARMLDDALAGSEVTDLLAIADLRATDAVVEEGVLELGLGFTLISRY